MDSAARSEVGRKGEKRAALLLCLINFLFISSCTTLTSTQATIPTNQGLTMDFEAGRGMGVNWTQGYNCPEEEAFTPPQLSSPLWVQYITGVPPQSGEGTVPLFAPVPGGPITVLPQPRSIHARPANYHTTIHVAPLGLPILLSIQFRPTFATATVQPNPNISFQTTGLGQPPIGGPPAGNVILVTNNTIRQALFGTTPQAGVMFPDAFTLGMTLIVPGFPVGIPKTVGCGQQPKTGSAEVHLIYSSIIAN